MASNNGVKPSNFEQQERYYKLTRQKDILDIAMQIIPQNCKRKLTREQVKQILLDMHDICEGVNVEIIEEVTVLEVFEIEPKKKNEQ